MRWLAGNGADTALAVRIKDSNETGAQKSGVCPHPSRTALQKAGATLANPTVFDPASPRESAIRQK
jgi:hypothetical protein